MTGLLLCALLAAGPRAVQGDLPQEPRPATSDLSASNGPASPLRATYTLGADDLIEVHAAEFEAIGDKPIRIDMGGDIRLPMLGRVPAAGLTCRQLEAEIAGRLKVYVLQPDVTVSISDFRSQPVSVLGAVKSPGIHQLQGRKTLIEVLSMAGGVGEDAGAAVKVTRRLEWGRIPLPGAADDPTGQFSVAEVRLKAILGATNPEQNIIIRPNDVITVPRAEMVYVVGQVVRSGGFVLNERESLSVLQALSLAGGLDRAASPQKSKILRPARTGTGRTEIAVDLRKILSGQHEDVRLQSDDILFVPSSLPKQAAVRALETAIQTGSGIAIWRR
jgi:polysaccharide export outer membrane protein